MVVSANVLQVMCMRLGKVGTGLDEGWLSPAARRTLTRMMATEGPVPILQWLESQTTAIVRAKVRRR
jgi:hypothetical protein